MKDSLVLFGGSSECFCGMNKGVDPKDVGRVLMHYRRLTIGVALEQ